MPDIAPYDIIEGEIEIGTGHSDGEDDSFNIG
jgi:hypothetical protein